MPARLNRRRYREIVATLKEVIADKKAPQQRRLRATETLLSVYERHDRNEERKAAQRRAADTTDVPTSTNAPVEIQETAEAAADRFLKSMQKESTSTNEQ